MEKKYIEFLTNKKYVESKIIYELCKDDNSSTINFFKNPNADLLSFIKYYDTLSGSDQISINESLERIMLESVIDASYDLVEFSGNTLYKNLVYIDSSESLTNGKKL